MRSAVKLVIVSAMLLTAPAAEAKTTVSFELPAQADAGSPVSFQYGISPLHAGASVVLQRKMGTSGAYRTTERLTVSRSRRGTMSELPLGKYYFRIAVLVKRSGKTIVQAQKTHQLEVFGNVTFASYFSQGEQTYTLPTLTFAWVFSVNPFPGETRTAVTVSAAQNTCRATHVQWFANRGDGAGTDDVRTVAVVQQTRDPIAGTSDFDKVASIDTTLTPGQSWAVNASVTGSADQYFYINGTASCYTTQRPA